MKSYNLILFFFKPVLFFHPTPKPWKASKGDSDIICVQEKGNIVPIIETADTYYYEKKGQNFRWNWKW